MQQVSLSSFTLSFLLHYWTHSYVVILEIADICVPKIEQSFLLQVWPSLLTIRPELVILKTNENLHTSFTLK
jgi:hypothetical protein